MSAVRLSSALALASGLLCGPVHAFDVVNDTGQSVTDYHLVVTSTLSGLDGLLNSEPWGTGTVSGVDGNPGQVKISWAGSALAPGATLHVPGLKVGLGTTGAVIVSSNWTPMQAPTGIDSLPPDVITDGGHRIVAVPEPASAVLTLLGLTTLGGWLRRRR